MRSSQSHRFTYNIFPSNSCSVGVVQLFDKHTHTHAHTTKSGSDQFNEQHKISCQLIQSRLLDGFRLRACIRFSDGSSLDYNLVKGNKRHSNGLTEKFIIKLIKHQKLNARTSIRQMTINKSLSRKKRVRPQKVDEVNSGHFK